ncbi:hypothetical protein OG598_04220 [Micromonospora sp. NBC_00330]|uniref:hypothetical protein n=1 Tax=Micromonospora sp. NBC_00330 TaxID=2903585 RepID=UPI002E28D11F|nr:hypothetical protein [Micromonospora sp. NBC_00330]
MTIDDEDNLVPHTPWADSPTSESLIARSRPRRHGTASSSGRRRALDGRAHTDAYPVDQHVHTAGHDSFDRVRFDVSELEVDATDSYRPCLDEIVAFVTLDDDLSPVAFRGFCG